MKSIQQFKAAHARPRINTLRVASAVKDGETITIGQAVFEASFDNVPTTGRVSINLAAAASLVAATITGTFSGVTTANDTITIGGQVYKSVGTLTGAANEVLIGGSAGATRDNYVAAIMKAAGEGTTYGTGTVANASVTAVASSTADIVLTAKAKGTPGNSIAISEAGSGFSFAGGATALAGGADASAADFTTAVVTAINAQPIGVSAEKISNNEVLVWENRPQTSALATTETLTGSNNAWGEAAMYGGAGKALDVVQMGIYTRVPNAQEVATATMHFPLVFAPVAVLVQVRVTSTGAPVASDAAVNIVGNRVTLSGGSTPVLATHTVTLLASE